MTDCMFCYVGKTEWDFAARHRMLPAGWAFQICDSCRLLLRNVIGPILHKLTHTQIVEALEDKMDELGITYDDLMSTPDDTTRRQSRKLTFTVPKEGVGPQGLPSNEDPTVRVYRQNPKEITS